MYLCALPLRVFSSYALDHIFGLSTQIWTSWLADEAKSVAINFLISIAGAMSFYLILRVFPMTWWMITAFLWVLFSVAAARLFPVLILPLFYEYMPIEDSGLKSDILSVAVKAGVKVIDVSRIDLSRKTRKANAALIGLGASRRIVLADNLIDGFTPGEVKVVVAHEIAHYKYRHMMKLISFAGIATFMGFFLFSRTLPAIAVLSGAEGVSDLRIFPVFVMFMMAFSIVIMPLQNFFSRLLEEQADAEALILTADKPGFISVMEKLAAMNLSEADPHPLKKWIFYNHPTIKERIAMAEKWEPVEMRSN